ncbi:MAG: hypothetical protein HFJ24_01980 [Clostridia bacterium]|nr:hypothetical protein [Clostridia bacterium]
MDKSGNSEEPINLDYLPLEKLRELITANDEKALNYYSIDEGLLYYATYREVITTVNGEQTDRTYEITENPPISYETITNMCNMPFNYLFTLLQESKNPDWVMAVIDLLLENSKVVLMIQDQLNVVTYTKVEKEYHVQKTEVEHYKEIEEHYGNETHTYWELESVDTSYDFPVGEPVVTTTVITTYTNTANVYIKEAHTWCIDFEQEATKVETITPGDEVTTLESYSSGDFGGLGYILVSTSGDVPTITRTYISARTLLYSTSEKQDVADYRFEVSPKYKEINYKKFLGLWKNKEGKYIKGEEYDENGKEVAYALPDEDTAKYYIPEKISDENGQNINELLELLRLHNNTEHHEQLMMYYWNVWMGEDIYDVDLDAILDIFNTNVSTMISGSAVLNYIKAWENGTLWKYQTGQSTTFPSKYLSEDEQYYIVYEDGSAGHNNIAFGIATFITNSKRVLVNHPTYGGGYYNHADTLGAHGVDVTTLYEGAKVPVAAVDAAIPQILSIYENKVDSYLRNNGITLSQTQRDALVNVCYKYGNIIGFAEAYNSSKNANGEIDPDLIRKNYSPFNYTSTVNDRKYANWRLFTQGEYTDRGGNVILVGGGSIIECAKIVHDYMAQNKYYYCTLGGEGTKTKNAHVSAGLTQCGLANSFEASKNAGNKGYRLTCCSTYVSWVLEEAGLVQKHNNGVPGLSNELARIRMDKNNIV